MLHLDDVTGVLARVPQMLRSRPRNSLDRLHVYEGRSTEELYPAPDRVPEVRRRRRWKLAGVESEDIRFESLHEPLDPTFRSYYESRRRRIHTVYSRRIRPRGTSSRPRLLYIHGYMQPETVFEELTLLTTMARMLNMEVVQIQPPYHGRRKPRRSAYAGELFWTADVVRSVESLRQTILDTRTLLSIMKEESDTPVGIAGLSLGGAFTASLACLEPRFSFAAPIIGHMDLGAILADAPVLGPMREDLARFGWTPEDFGDFFERIGWNALRPVIPVERIILFAAEHDHFCTPQKTREMQELWGGPRVEWYPTSHMGFIPHIQSVMTKLREFVDALD